jgi:hypothetical protein
MVSSFRFCQFQLWNLIMTEKNTTRIRLKQKLHKLLKKDKMGRC